MNHTENPLLEEVLNYSIEDKKKTLQQWNDAYRTGEALVDDITFDTLLESLPEDDQLKSKVGFEVHDQRKTELPLPMYSMDKVKSHEEILKWMESKDIPEDETVVITPKYDGLSFLLQPSTGKAYTRGNGKFGQRSNEHYLKLSTDKNYSPPQELKERHLIGEVIMPRRTFSDKYSEQYKNPRNLVAGLFNQKEPDDMLQDVNFIAYGIGEENESKADSLKLIDQFNVISLPSHFCKLQELNDEFLIELFEKWNTDYEIDGLIIEVERRKLRLSLGREKNSNPAYSRAWKGFQAQSAETSIQDITFQVSKDGRLAAVAHIEPVSLDGVTVSNVTLYNAGMMKEKGWGIGAQVKIIRSGMVIPKIIETLQPVEPTLPSTCPSCNTPVSWDENQIHLMCSNKNECRSIQVQSMVSFFKVMEIEEVGEKLVEQLYDSGFKNIETILKMTQEDFLNQDRFAEKKAILVHDSIHSKCKNVPLEKIQHASGCFFGLGTKKLILLNAYRDPQQQPSIEEISNIDGYSEISAKAYLSGIHHFWAFLDTLPITLLPYQEALSEDGPMTGMRLCFTGFRDKDLEQKVTQAGGKIVSGVNGKTTHLVAKDITGKSSKLKKASDLGMTLWNKESLENYLSELP